MKNLICFALIISSVILYGCSTVNDPETMKTAASKQSQNDAENKNQVAENQKSTSGRVLAAGSHITGAILGG